MTEGRGAEREDVSTRTCPYETGQTVRHCSFTLFNSISWCCRNILNPVIPLRREEERARGGRFR
jgi:hypothetical protein